MELRDFIIPKSAPPTPCPPPAYEPEYAWNECSGWGVRRVGKCVMLYLIVLILMDSNNTDKTIRSKLKGEGREIKRRETTRAEKEN
jgi:hypothetical protein